MSVFQRLPINHKPTRYKTPFGGFSEYVAPTIVGGGISEDIAYAWTGNNTLNDEITSLTLTNNGSVTYDTGKVGDAFLFDGSNRLTIADSLALRAGTEFTLTLMYYHVTSFDFGNCVIGKFTNFNTPEYAIVFDDFGTVQFGFGNRGFNYMYSSTSMVDATWYFITVWNSATLDQRGIRVKNLSDGVNTTDTQLGELTVNTSTTPLNIGAGNGSSFVPNGSKIDGIAKWNRKLTLSEIESLEDGINGSEYPY